MAEISSRGVTKRYPDGTEAVKDTSQIKLFDHDGGRNLSVERPAATSTSSG